MHIIARNVYNKNEFTYRALVPHLFDIKNIYKNIGLKENGSTCQVHSQHCIRRVFFQMWSKIAPKIHPPSLFLFHYNKAHCFLVSFPIRDIHKQACSYVVPELALSVQQSELHTWFPLRSAWMQKSEIHKYLECPFSLVHSKFVALG